MKTGGVGARPSTHFSGRATKRVGHPVIIGPLLGKRSPGKNAIIARNQRPLVVFVTKSLNILWQARMENCRWTEKTNIASAHVQHSLPRIIKRQLDKCWSFFKISTIMPSCTTYKPSNPSELHWERPKHLNRRCSSHPTFLIFFLKSGLCRGEFRHSA